MAKKWLILKNTTKAHIHSFFRGWGLRGRSRIRRESQNRILLLYFDYFLSPNGKRSRLTACLELSLVSLTLQRVLCFETFEKKYWQIRCIGLPRIINLVCLERRNYGCFTWNLVQNLMKLVSISRTIRMWPKITKTKKFLKKAYMHLSEAKD